MEKASETERKPISHQIAREHATVVESDARAAQIFGLNGFPQKVKFEELLKIWKDAYPTADSTWFDSCCEQILMGAKRGFPVIRLSALKEVGGEASYTPVLNRIRPVPFSGTVQFDFYFYNLSDPRAVAAGSRMIPLDGFFYKNLGQINAQSLKLRQVIDELDSHKLNRVPIFSADNHPMYIIHRSMIDKFIVKHVLSAVDDRKPSDLTVADLLADPEMKEMFEKTFVVVNHQATIADAKNAMLTRPGCSDVFVTMHGGVNEPVQGWLTNVDIARSREHLHRNLQKQVLRFEEWREVRARLLGLLPEIVPAGQELAELAGELKVTKKMSLADCFAAALAKREKAEIYTGDPEFKTVEREIKVVWL